ncbi:MAG: lipid-A-disaccharide synthase [Deltaproteobacteria bacterium]|nr:lipid-A-disaccharide synthase [Deltaproteobacteria bacterium]
MNRGKEIMLVVGEASGDIHGANLVKALLKRDPDLRFFGVGGEQLQQTPFEVIFSVAKLTGMGLIEVAGNIQNIWQAYRLLSRSLRTRQPSLLILIDFPEFNLRLAKIAKKLGVPVLYYVSPQVWAWRQGRIRQIAETVDTMAVVFPFEVKLYEGHKMPVHFVGHPLLDIVQVKQEREAVLRDIGLQKERPVIALLPGSRRKEIDYHLPIMVEAAVRLNRIQQTQFFCVRASTVDRTALQKTLHGAAFGIPIVEAGRYDAVNAADLVWTASGTATLETALLAKPMIVVYRVSWMTYWLARLLVNVKYISIANIIAGERIVPELVQAELTPERLVRESRSILNDGEARQRMITNLAQLRGQLGSPGAAHRVAELATSMMS